MSPYTESLRQSLATSEGSLFELFEPLGGSVMSSILHQKTSTVNVFAPLNAIDGYLVNRSLMTSEHPEGNNAIVPLVVDTEYLVNSFHWTLKSQSPRIGITTQIKSLDKGTLGVIFSHPEVADKLPRFPVASSEFHPVDYLRYLGYDVKLRVSSKVPEGRPIIHFYLYAFFALAECMMVVRGDCAKTFKGLLAEKAKNPKNGSFEMQRHLRASSVRESKRGTTTENYVELPWIMTLEGYDYAVRLTWVDAGAIHGMGSYKDFCEASGIKLDAKDNFTPEEKGKMLDMAIQRPEDFDAYALGDLEVYEALEANAEKFKGVYKAVGAFEHYKAPKLTIGSTVKDLFQGVMKNLAGIKPGDNKAWKAFEDKYLKRTSAQHIRTLSQSTIAILSKVEGGRCRNNRPTTVNIDTPIVDLDISGCYGEGQRNQIYPFGYPSMTNWEASSEVNDYWTLRDFLKFFKGELVSGAWVARVSTFEPLQYPQDFLASWFVGSQHGEDIMAKYCRQMTCDSEQVAVEERREFNEEDGHQKIFHHEILNGTITHDFIQWLENICSPKQRSELLDKLRVKAYMVYKASDRVDSLEAVFEANKNHNGKNIETLNKAGRRVTVDGECHAWYGKFLDKLLIDALLSNRKLYAKKTPMNTLFKLSVNTMYGDMTSKFFTCANIVVGNNITARARALAWYMEKGLWGFQTITDGCGFELNRVVYPKPGRRVTPIELVDLYRRMGKGNVTTAPLSGHLKTGAIGQVERIDLTWQVDEEASLKAEKTVYIPVLTLYHAATTTVYVGKEAFNWINRAAMEHLQTLFPGVDVLHAESTSLTASKGENGEAVTTYEKRIGQFEFEAKDFYNSGVFHGSGNYCFENPNGENLKYRAYETKKPHESVLYDGETPNVTGRYNSKNNPAKDFMSQLKHPEAVIRQEPFVKSAMLKPGDFKNRIETWESLGLVPGDNFWKPGILREFSLSQFTFKTLDQQIGWEKAVTLHKDKFGQSVERFFINPDGTLNYLEMVQTVDKLISEGCMKPFEALDPKRRKNRTSEHPCWDSYLKLKTQLSTPPA